MAIEADAQVALLGAELLAQLGQGAFDGEVRAGGLAIEDGVVAVGRRVCDRDCAFVDV